MTTKQAAMEREHTEQFLAYKKIVEEIAAADVMYYDETFEEPCCIFCLKFKFFSEPHKSDCIWIRSKALVDKE